MFKEAAVSAVSCILHAGNFCKRAGNSRVERIEGWHGCFQPYDLVGRSTCGICHCDDAVYVGFRLYFYILDIPFFKCKPFKAFPCFLGCVAFFNQCPDFFISCFCKIPAPFCGCIFLCRKHLFIFDQCLFNNYSSIRYTHLFKHCDCACLCCFCNAVKHSCAVEVGWCKLIKRVLARIYIIRRFSNSIDEVLIFLCISTERFLKSIVV